MKDQNKATQKPKYHFEFEKTQVDLEVVAQIACIVFVAGMFVGQFMHHSNNK